MPWAGGAAGVPQIIKRDIHTAGLVFTVVSPPPSDTLRQRLSFVPARGAVAGWWSSFPSGLGLLYPGTHLHIAPSPFRGPTVWAKTARRSLAVPVNPPCPAVTRLTASRWRGK